MTTDATPDDLALPPAFTELHEIGIPWVWDDDEDTLLYGCDFEFYPHFAAPDHTAWWFRMWTGNEEVDGSEFRFFGTSGAGDYAGFWLVRDDTPITGQPVVLLGSEGQIGVIARDLGALLWVFANGSGPVEALDDPDEKRPPNETFHAIAERYAPGQSRPTAEIVAEAQQEFPDFEAYINAMCC
ncbi:SMI1/KNR4 family protein [Saccharopolyspora taberi]|uniref:SMI1/KNR4 family protein n=1 Tax=Saccharopolyspora taberi TaxID=60895 RepID=A0ABN3V8P8_9PSEU